MINVRDFKDIKATTQKHLDRERKSTKTPGWAIYGERTIDYEKDFKGVLAPFSTFDALLESRKRQGKGANVLDIMAPVNSFVARLQHLDIGIAVTLSDKRRPINKVKDLLKSVRGSRFTQIEKDIYSREAWNDIDTALQERAPRHNVFDVIVCRPYAGMRMDETAIPANIVLLRRAWERLSFDDGLIFFHIKPNIKEPDLIERILSWLDYLKENYGIESKHDPTTDAILLKKIRTSPKELPIMPAEQKQTASGLFMGKIRIKLKNNKTHN